MKTAGISIFFFLNIFFVNPVFSQDVLKTDCRVYLNFPYYSFEITGGFNQVYKISKHYNLFSQQCNSFLNYVFETPILNNFIFQNGKNECNVYYEKIFNCCRCDSSSFLYIYKPPETSVVKERKEIFNKEKFDASLLQIRDSALAALCMVFPRHIIKIEISSAIRSVDDQEKYFKKGSSTTLLSAHIFGAAADFTIFFNGILIDPKPKGKGLFQNAEPYQILGKYILDNGYFWGIPWDPGHMQLQRKIEDILIEFPEMQNNPNLITLYYNIIKNDSIPLKYKPVIDILDNKFGMKKARIYDSTQLWINDSLLTPITVDPFFMPSFLY